jgi:hypothetical protein
MRAMKSCLWAVLACALVACSAQPSPTPSPAPINTVLIQDGQLVIDGFDALEPILAAIPGAPGQDIQALRGALTALQADLVALQGGTMTGSAFAKLVQQQVASVTPALLSDFKANAAVTTGVLLIEGLVPILLSDVQQVQTSSVPSAAAADPRGKLRAWINSVKR